MLPNDAIKLLDDDRVKITLFLALALIFRLGNLYHAEGFAHPTVAPGTELLEVFHFQLNEATYAKNNLQIEAANRFAGLWRIGETLFIVLALLACAVRRAIAPHLFAASAAVHGLAFVILSCVVRDALGNDAMQSSVRWRELIFVVAIFVFAMELRRLNNLRTQENGESAGPPPSLPDASTSSSSRPRPALRRSFSPGATASRTRPGLSVHSKIVLLSLLQFGGAIPLILAGLVRNEIPLFFVGVTLSLVCSKVVSKAKCPSCEALMVEANCSKAPWPGRVSLVKTKCGACGCSLRM